MVIIRILGTGSFEVERRVASKRDGIEARPQEHRQRYGNSILGRILIVHFASRSSPQFNVKLSRMLHISVLTSAAPIAMVALLAGCDSSILTLRSTSCRNTCLEFQRPPV